MIQKYEYNGEKKSVRQWALTTGIPQSTLHRRLKSGEDIATALSKEPRHYGTLLYNGKTYTYKKLAEEFGLNIFTLYSRIHGLGMSVEDAVKAKRGQAKKTNKNKCCYPDCDNCPFPDCVA